MDRENNPHGDPPHILKAAYALNHAGQMRGGNNILTASILHCSFALKVWLLQTALD